LDIAAGRIEAGAVAAILAAKDRARAGFTAPACGLVLDEVFYDLP
jgi:tRNA pseudouridine38-40 synthase